MLPRLATAADPPRLPRDNLLLYRAANGDAVPVKSVADWLRRRDDILRGVAAIMGPLPTKDKRCALDVTVFDEVDCGKYTRRSISYASEPDSRVPAYLLIPKSAGRGPGVLCLHPTDDKVGHGVVIGLGSSRYPAYANELAERGFVVLAPNYPMLAQYQPDLKALGWESGTLKAVWDNIRGIDLLESLPNVQLGGVAAIGHSLGGHNAVFTAIHDERVRIAVSSCGLDSFADYYGGDPKVWQAGKGWTQIRYMPRLAAFGDRLSEIPFDFHELIGALAPRHVLLIAPQHDDNFRAASVDRIVAAARPVFELYRVPDRLIVEHPNCPHEFPLDMRKKAYDMIDSVLRKENAK
jgi:dienelactone hydrolase